MITENDSPPPPPSIFSHFPFEDLKQEIEHIDELKILYSKNLEIKKLSNIYHLKLINPKIRLVSLEEIKNLKTIKSDIDSFYEKLEKKYGNHHLLVVSTPIFTKKKDIIIFGINYLCGGKCGEGKTYICIKINNKWQIEKDWKWES
ncbi:MAG: hypothetical protein IPH28_16995 [Cytophagaceae bacterium]|nr:hypothetical protein [Cytophagaceae bacterium]